MLTQPHEQEVVFHLVGELLERARRRTCLDTAVYGEVAVMAWAEEGLFLPLPTDGTVGVGANVGQHLHFPVRQHDDIDTGADSADDPTVPPLVSQRYRLRLA